MRLKTVVTLGALMLVAFFAIEWGRTRQAPAGAVRLPSAVQQPLEFVDGPRQRTTDDKSFAFKGFQIEPLAQFSIRARVLSRENYVLGHEGTLSPVDLALGWNRMADPAVYGALQITQGGRWYHYRWKDHPPIAPQEIVETSANMHMIPANAAVEKTLRKAREGVFIRLSGHLVQATHPSGWRWTSSLTRADSGANACELVFVDHAEIEP